MTFLYVALVCVGLLLCAVLGFMVSRALFRLFWRVVSWPFRQLARLIRRRRSAEQEVEVEVEVDDGLHAEAERELDELLDGPDETRFEELEQAEQVRFYTVYDGMHNHIAFHIMSGPDDLYHVFLDGVEVKDADYESLSDAVDAAPVWINRVLKGQYEL